MADIHCYTEAQKRIREIIEGELRRRFASVNPRRIVIKPNWVLHETDPAFPIRALVTDPRVIEATVDACLELFPSSESILIGDCPLQFADWPLLREQSGLNAVIERLKKKDSRIQFRDLRKDAYAKAGGNFLVRSETEHGDPAGYREVEIGKESHLEAISNQAGLFAVNDYNATFTSRHHKPGSHRYLVSQSCLDADLFINLPKWKSHQKSGITAALKNLVGINSDKAYLPHFRRGAPKWGGDEYRDENRWLYYWQTTLRERFQKKSKFAYTMLKPGWEALKRLRGIETRMTDPKKPAGNFYIAGGAWHGNQTIWRMIYDLNLIIQCVDAEGKLQPRPVRRYLAIVDGLVSGEGNGPLQPLPRETNWLVAGEDPFAVDTALSWFMGFDPAKIPLLSQRSEYNGADWGKFDLKQLKARLDEETILLMDSAINFEFVPPPGWRGHIERRLDSVAA